MAAWMALASSKLASWHQLMTAAWPGAEHSSSSSEGFWFVFFATMSSIELDCFGVFLLQSSLCSFDGGLPLYFWELLGAFGGRGRDFGRDFGGDLPSSLHSVHGCFVIFELVDWLLGRSLASSILFLDV